MKSKYKILSLAIFALWLSSCSDSTNTPYIDQIFKSAIDTVYYFKPGTGQNIGQDSLYFPANIFGLPYKYATPETPAISPEDICSIGFGGTIIVGFTQFEIVDGEGPDFVIFENSFINPINNKYFAEPARVSVSSDGINYIDFPFDSLTLKGCAGLTPTDSRYNIFDPKLSGGDAFDLRDINMPSARFIKITDISLMVKNNPSHPYYDPTITGFDLDAVLGINLKVLH